MFPELLFDDIDDVGGWGGDRTRWTGPYAINATVTKLMGTAQHESGRRRAQSGDKSRRQSIARYRRACAGGQLHSFDPLFTSRNGVGGHEFASLLLGLPVDGSVPFNLGEGKWFTHYYGALRPGRLARELESHRDLWGSVRA